LSHEPIWAAIPLDPEHSKKPGEIAGLLLFLALASPPDVMPGAW
jgi:hypothetical protein